MLWDVDTPSVLPSPPVTEGSGGEEEEEESLVSQPDEGDGTAKQAPESAGDGTCSSRHFSSTLDTPHKLTFKEWLKMSPVYPNEQVALNDVGYALVKTPSYKNCCLLYAYSICRKASTAVDGKNQE